LTIVAACEPIMQALEVRMLLAVHTPMTGTAFQTALNNAALGDTIVLNAGTTYTGQFTLPDKTTGSGWITIQSSNLAQLPGEGVRVQPADAANMARLQAPGSNASVVRTPPGKQSVGTPGNPDYIPPVPASPAHHYKFVGVEFVGPANNSSLTALMELGTSTDAQTQMSSVPHDIIIDRCYFRPNIPTASIRRAIALNSASTDITNSYIEEIHQPGSDSQAIAGWNGPGPFNIINNRLEGASENIMFGGDTTRLVGAVPSNIVIRGNHIIKPLHWRDFSYNVKNLFELKAGSNVLVEDNIMENNWTQGQTGVAIVLKLGNWSPETPQIVTEDVMIRNNIIRHSNGSIALQGRDYASNSPEGLVRRISFVNNLFDDVNGKWGTSGTGGGTFNIYLTHGPKDVTFDHNTFFNGYTAIEVDSNSATYSNENFKFDNNIIAHNSYGVRSPLGTGNPTINAYLSDGAVSFTKNILMGGNANLYTARPGNYFPSSWAAVGFVDKTNFDYNLAPASIYNNAGTDGKDIGADISLLPAEFAYVTGTTLNVRFDRITHAPRPITLDADGAAITAMYDGEILPFTGITAINVVGTAGDDQLLLDGTTAVPMTFDSGGGNDDVEVINQAGEAWTFQNDIGSTARNVALDVLADATAVFNATQRLRSLDVAGQATLSQGGAKLISTRVLTVPGKLNLTDNDLLLDYTGADMLGTFNGTSYDGVLGLLASGYNFSAYDGNGLITDMPQALAGETTLGASRASDIYGVGASDTTLYQGETIDGSTVIVKYSYAGDLTFDGSVDAADYGVIDNWVQFPGTSGYANGDFNFDGVIDAADYGVIDNSVQLQGPPL
jgi:hypothetical protein